MNRAGPAALTAGSQNREITMASDTASALAHRFLEVLNAADGRAAAALVADDVAFDWAGEDRQIGRDALRERLVRFAAEERASVSDVEIMANASDTRAAAEFTLRAGEAASAAAFFEADGGRISRVTLYRGR